MVTQVPVIGILMIVNGCLTGLMGLLLAAMGPFLFSMSKVNGQGVPPGQEKMLAAMSFGYAAVGVVVLVGGILNVIGGIRVYHFRGRTFAIVALFANLASIFTCYCSASSFGLMIWGLIVLFNSDVADAFKLGEDGWPPEEIKHRARRTSHRDSRDIDDRDEEPDEPRPAPPPMPRIPDSPTDDRIK